MSLPLPKEIQFSKTTAPPLAAGLRQRALEGVRAYIAKANALYRRSFPMPTVSFDLRGKTAGQAYYQKNHIRLNPVLFTENIEEFLGDTVPHEVAHLVARQLHLPKTIQSHGVEWQAVMRDFGLKPRRCHSYDVTNAQVGKAYAYRCGCRDHTLSSRKHLAVTRGARYTCRKCRELLVCVEGLAPAPRARPAAPLPPSPAARPPEGRPPTEKMVSYLRSLAQSLNRTVAPEVWLDFKACSALIETFKNALAARPAPPAPSVLPPTEKQLAYAQSIASKKGLVVPADTLQSRTLLSAWIDANR